MLKLDHETFSNFVSQKNTVYQFTKRLKIKLMKYCILLFLYTLAFNQNITAQEKEKDKLSDVLEVLEDLPDDATQEIPDDLMNEAEAIVIVPMLRKGGLIVGGKFGKGVAMVKNEAGEWSDPAFLKLTGGSIGLQIGYTSSDVLLIFKKAKTLKRLTSGKGKLTLGGDIAVAAGPDGEAISSINTDLDFKAEIYSYSINRGLFAGVSVDGSELKIDDRANENFYGDEELGRQILKEGISGLKPSEIIVNLKKELANF